MRILKLTGSTITISWEVDGTATNVGDVTIGIVDALGVVVVAAGTATVNNTDGTYSYIVSNSLTGNVADWTTTWTDTSTGDDLEVPVGVVGAHLFTEVAARAFDNDAFSNATTYPDSNISAARDRIADAFEDICGTSFISRYRTESLSGEGTRLLRLDEQHVTTVLTATVGGTAQTIADIVILQQPANRLWHTGAFWSYPTVADPLNVVVGYEYGHATVPTEIRLAALHVLRHELAESDIPDRATGITNEFGNIPLATAGMRGAWFGLPVVDSVLMRYEERAYA